MEKSRMARTKLQRESQILVMILKNVHVMAKVFLMVYKLKKVLAVKFLHVDM